MKKSIINNPIKQMMNERPLSVEAQEIYVCVAKYNNDRINRFLNTKLCQDQYSAEDIEDFKTILDTDIPNASSINLYWNLDTAARDYFIEIIEKVFCCII